MPVITHGHTRLGKGTKTYRSWVAMLTRCTNKNHVAFNRYGGSGISVCDRWKDFKNFLSDMGERPTAKTLDRYPNNRGNYEPGNYRWATNKEQHRNVSYNKMLTINGKTQCMAAWAEERRLHPDTLFGRVKNGWPAERLLIPARPRGPNKTIR